MNIITAAPHAGVYTTEDFVIPSSGKYTIKVEDHDGNTYSLFENLNGDLLPPITSLNVDLTETQVYFTWDTVTGAAFYRVEIYDLDDNRLYRFDTEEAGLTVPEGFLKKNTTYKYRVKAHDHFPEANINYAATSFGFFQKHVFTTSPEPGESAPELDFINGSGAFISYNNAYNYGDSACFLVLSVGVSDEDGVPGNISKIEVTYPDGTTKKELIFDFLRDNTHAGYEFEEPFTDTSGIQEGTYTFTVTDNEGNTDTITDTLEITSLDRPVLTSPAHNSRVYTNTPELTWEPVSGADFYRVRVYSGANNTIYRSQRLPVTSFTMPPDILETGMEYSYRIYAYALEDNMISCASSSTFIAADRPYFSVDPADIQISGRLVDADMIPLSDIEIAVNGASTRQSITSAVTGSDGCFTLYPDQAGPCFLTINNDMDQGLPADRVTNLNPENGQVLGLGDITLAYGAVVTGSMVDAQGAPLTDFNVHYSSNVLDGSIRTDEEGVFTCILRPGVYNMTPGEENSDAWFYTSRNHITVRDDSTPVDAGTIPCYTWDDAVYLLGTVNAPPQVLSGIILLFLCLPAMRRCLKTIICLTPSAPRGPMTTIVITCRFRPTMITILPRDTLPVPLREKTPSP